MFRYFSETNCLDEEFTSLFFEDTYKEVPNYIDYLYHLHSQVIEHLKKIGDYGEIFVVSFFNIYYSK
jgi:hypothetical protein